MHLFGTIWREKNRRCFEDVEIRSSTKIPPFCLVLEWVRIGSNGVPRSMVDLVDWLLLLSDSCIYYCLGSPVYILCILVCFFL